MADQQFSFATHIPPIDLSFNQGGSLQSSTQANIKPVKTSVELEMEKIEEARKSQIKNKLKQQRLYQKILKQQQLHSQTSALESIQSEIKKKTSYVQTLIEKGKIQISKNPDQKLTLGLSLKRKNKNKKKRTLTVSTPFELKTSKRVRIEIDEKPSQTYEPLWAQIQKSFKLRDEDETMKSCPNTATKKQLTRPRSPNLQTIQRMKLKDDLSVASADRALVSSEFKARPLNKRIFESQSKLPQVERKTKTEFDEFRLSRSNAKLAKKTFEEYQNKENSSINLFRAKSVDRRVLLGQGFPTPKTELKRKLTQFSPFNLKTEERMTAKQQFSQQSELDDCSSVTNTFRAREMPKYKFFEVKPQEHKKILFQEFKLATINRSASRKRSNSQENEDSQIKFQALPMPDFEKMKPKTTKKATVQFAIKPEPFNLTTDMRGKEYSQKFLSIIQQEKKNLEEQARFKAREFKIKFFEPKIQSNEHSATKPVEVKLHSIERSKAREEFQRKLLEKEQQLLLQKQKLVEEKERQEQEEIKRLREQLTFKASGIKKFKGLDGSKVSEKTLTIPMAPKLHTLERAHLKEDVVMDNQ